MKQSIIKYVKQMNGQIKIIGFKNVASISKLEREFGPEIKQAYLESEPMYIKTSNDTISVNGSEFNVDQTISKEQFQSIIGTMKAAGLRLIELRDQIDTRVHEVRI